MYRQSMGGIGTYSRELLHQLLPLCEDFDVFVFLTEDDRPEWTCELPNVTSVFTSIPHHSVAEQTQLSKILRSYNLDLVHFLNVNHPVRYSGPFVVTLHDLTMLLIPNQGSSLPGRVKQRAFEVVFRHALTASKRIIAISRYTAKDAVDNAGVPEAKTSIVYEGGPASASLEFDRAKVSSYLGTDDPFFLFVSAWRRHKGIATLVEAFEIFKSRVTSPYRLVLVGNPSKAPKDILDTVENSPIASQIVRPGFVPDDVLPQLYHFSQALVMPSEYEGFGLPVLEAFSYGTPVIAAENSSLPEVVGSGGILFPTGDSGALADAMVSMIDDKKRDSYLELGREHLKAFSWERCARETLEVYKDCLSLRSQPI